MDFGSGPVGTTGSVSHTELETGGAVTRTTHSGKGNRGGETSPVLGGSERSGEVSPTLGVGPGRPSAPFRRPTSLAGHHRLLSQGRPPVHPTGSLTSDWTTSVDRSSRRFGGTGTQKPRTYVRPPSSSLCVPSTDRRASQVLQGGLFP